MRSGPVLLVLAAIAAAQSSFETGRPGFVPRQAGLRPLLGGAGWAYVRPAGDARPDLRPPATLSACRTAEEWAALWTRLGPRPPEPFVEKVQMALVLEHGPRIEHGLEVLAVDEEGGELVVHWHDAFPRRRLPGPGRSRTRAVTLVLVRPLARGPVSLGVHGRGPWIADVLRRSGAGKQDVLALEDPTVTGAARTRAALRAVGHRDPRVVRATVGWLAGRPLPREVLEPLSRLARSEDEITRMRLTMPLAAAARSGGPAVRGVDRLLDDPSEMVRTRMVDELHDHRVPPAPCAVRLARGVVDQRFGHSDARARTLLIACGSAAVPDLLTQSLAADPRVGARAIETLAILGREADAAIPRLAPRALRAPFREIRLAALSAVARIGTRPRAVTSVLRESVRDVDPVVAEHAQAIARGLVGHRDGDLRGAAFEVLAPLVHEQLDLYDLLKPLVRDPDPALRSRAREFFRGL